MTVISRWGKSIVDIVVKRDFRIQHISLLYIYSLVTSAIELILFFCGTNCCNHYVSDEQEREFGIEEVFYRKAFVHRMVFVLLNGVER